MKRLKFAQRGLVLMALAPTLAAFAQQAPPRIDQLVQDLGEEPIDIRRYTVEVVVFRYAENVSVGNEVFVPDPPPFVEQTVRGEGPFTDEGQSIGGAAGDGQALDGTGEADDGQSLTADGQSLADTAVDGRVPADTDSVATDAGVEDDAEQNAEAAEPSLQSGKPIVEYLLLTEDELTLGDVIVFPEMEPKTIEIDSLAEPAPGLDGSFTLYLSRYLHLNVDLALDEPPAFDDPVAIEDPVRSFGDARAGYNLFDDRAYGKVRYRIREDRIFKSGDLRYFDHPKFGLVVRVSRVEEPEQDELTDDPLLPVQPAIE